ncbi:MAG TPA: OmpA family protein [Chlamydiales bacterium]|jgi:outer membrane protein OmpA-like peptidoglycan-associated protein
MKLPILLALFLSIATGCSKNSSQSWEDVKTAGRYMQRGVDSMWGKDYESRMLASEDEFTGPYSDEFIPLSASDLRGSFGASDMALPQPKGIPGEHGIPSLDQFQTPSNALRSLFQAVHFETDDFIVRDKNELHALAQITSYMKKNPNVYLVVRGHCDERASASYNMSLGLRRANYIRTLLVKNGIDLNRVYTISRGKEEPLAEGHAPDDWKLNRRAEFKIYEK